MKHLATVIDCNVSSASFSGFICMSLFNNMTERVKENI